MSFAEELRKKAEYSSKIEKNVQKAIDHFKKLTEESSKEGFFERTVFFACTPSEFDKGMAEDIIHRCASILEEELGFAVEIGSSFTAPDSRDKKYYVVVPITLRW